MRREELLTAVEDVRLALLESKLGEALARLMLPAPNEEMYRARLPDALEGLKRYTISAQKYNEASRDLTRILKLDDLEKTELWLDLMTGSASPDPRLREWHERIRLVEDVLPGVVGLLQPESLRELMERTDDTQPVLRGKSLLSVVMLENDDRFATPRRLIGILDAVQMLYSAGAELEGVSAETLHIAACDSGRDKSFDFVGVGRVIEQMREIIQALWERVVFYREQPTASRLELIARKLPVIDRIEELEESGKIEAKVAEHLRRQIVEAAGRFILAGAIIPEVEQRASSLSPRELLSGTMADATGDADDDMFASLLPNEAPIADLTGLNLENLSSDDRGNLMRLLEMARREAAAEPASSAPAEAEAPAVTASLTQAAELEEPEEVEAEEEVEAVDDDAPLSEAPLTEAEAAISPEDAIELEESDFTPPVAEHPDALRLEEAAVEAAEASEDASEEISHADLELDESELDESEATAEVAPADLEVDSFEPPDDEPTS